MEQDTYKTFMAYPNINFWKEPTKNEKLTIINEQDFPQNQILESLEIAESSLIKGFGTCDIDEILSRQDLLKYMIENPALMKWLMQADTSSPLPGMSQSNDRSAEEFLRYFNPKTRHTPFWRMNHKLLSLLSGDGLPTKLHVFRMVLREGLGLEKREDEMGKGITEMIQNVALIEGLLSFTLETEYAAERYKISKVYQTSEQRAGNHVHGYKKYSRSFLNVREINSIPEWTYNRYNPANWLGIGKIVRELAVKRDQREKDKAFQDMVIDTASDHLIQDIEDGLLNVLRKLSWKNDECVDKSEISVYFSYSSDGLKVQIFYWKARPLGGKNVKFEFAEHQGYTPDKLEVIKKVREQYQESLANAHTLTKTAYLLKSIEDQDEFFFDRTHMIKSPCSDIIYKWYAISNLYHTTFRSSYEMLTVHRNFFFDHINVLKNIAEVAYKLSKISKKIDSPLCWPEIIADESTHIVSFESIVPIHLLRHLPKEKKPIPIESMPTLNGQIIGLTGDHEGGKTTTMLAYAELIYLAQSGLPVFGKGVELNLKSHLGLVFLTKEEGPSSTARTLIDKMVRVIKDSKEVDPKKVVLIFDELGEGTQESSGDKLGRDLLTSLGNSGISIIFNTQITSLAEYAQNILGAQCMRFSVDHRIYPGIGSGNMDDLRERSGLNAELAQIAITA